MLATASISNVLMFRLLFAICVLMITGCLSATRHRRSDGSLLDDDNGVGRDVENVARTQPNDSANMRADVTTERSALLHKR